MKRTTKLSLALLAATAIGAVAVAPVLAHGPQANGWMQGGQHMPGAMMGAQGGPGMMRGNFGPGAMMGGYGGPAGMAGMMGDPEVMQQMMQMHQQMGSMMGQMGGPGMMGGPGTMGGPGMMGGLFGEFDADEDGTVTVDEMYAGLEAQLEKFDADGDGTLSLEEFESLHADMIRGNVANRFQALDEDGDGKVTADEITAPADHFALMQSMHEAGGVADDAPEETEESN